MADSPHRDDVSGGEAPRPMEIDGGDIGGGAAKRRRKDGGREEEEMRRVAELVLVLSAMGRMRGGREPTVAEAAMMAEARKKVVAMCEELAPKDIVPKEVFGGVIDDLGLHRLKDQRLGFRPSKLSISEKIEVSKRKMEQSLAFAAQPTSYTSQQVQTGVTAGETRETAPPAPMFSSDKVGQIPVSTSTGTLQPSPSAVQLPVIQPSVVQVSTAASSPLPLHRSSAEARQPVASTPVSNKIGKDSTSVAPPRVDRTNIRPDGRLNVPSPVPQVTVSSAANRHTVKTTPVHLQPQSTSRVVVGAKNKAPDPLTARIPSTIAPQKTAQALANQTPKTVVNQTVTGPVPIMHHPVQSLQFGHPPVVNHHLEISKLIHRLLNPKLPPRPAWTSPSRDYMCRAQPCQFCRMNTNEVDDVVVCDACEKTFHLGCLQSHNAKSIPRGEWHCPRCLSMSHGKPFPPKYGRVTRNMNAKGHTIAQFPSDKKTKSLNKKVAQPNATTNGTALRAKSQVVKAPEPSSGSNLPNESGTSRMAPAVGIKKEDGSNLGPHLNETKRDAVDASESVSTESSGDKPHQRVMKSEVSHSEDGFISETESSTPAKTQANRASDHVATVSHFNHLDQKLPNAHGNNGVAEYNQALDKRCQTVVLQPKLAVTEIVNTAESNLHNVDWMGDTDRIMDAKKFYQSCRINGVVYQLQDYALFRASNGKLTPLRLQGMWEDTQSNSKWLLVHRCYFPDDLPQEAGRPGAPQRNEVYESIHDSNMMAGFIQGPCEVLPFRKFGEQTERSQANDRMRPVFVRNWFYDESKRAFCPSAS